MDERIVRRRKKGFYMPSAHEMQMQALAKKIDFWKKMATENMKRALRAETQLAQYEGPIG